ncbi:protein PAIR1 isoform X2 [Triticum aestivum]|uniref:protein PAIR1 isoform X2 n=1 Tax=Triticum aestivum TaxID=4565 RepID=UPI001D017D17|nr:protein PAIR1-like isoform X2 [Triticum aestivum]
MQLPPSGSNFLPGAPLLLAGHRRRLAGEGKGGGADEARDQQRVRPPRRLSPPARSGGGRAGAPPASSSAASAAGNPPQAAPSQQQQAFSLPRPKLPRLPESEAFVDQTLHRPTPARHQGFGLHDDSSERMPPFPPSSACGAQEEPQQQQPVIIPSSTTLRWNPSPTDTRCRVNEDAECRFQQLSGSVHKVGMVLDSVQTDVIQLNRTMKDASVESGGVQQKFDLLEDTLQKIIKGQNDLKVLAENSMKSNSDQLNVLNSRTSKLNEMSLVVSVCPKQVQADLRELHGDIFRVLTKDMEGVVRDIRSLNTRPAAMSMLPDQNFSPNERLPRNPMLAKGSPLMNGVSVANRRPTMNQTPAANERPLMNQSPVANGRSTMNQTPVANGRSLMNQTPVKNGSPMTIPVGDGRSQLKQTPVTDGTPQRDLTPEINGRPQKDRIPVANGRPHMEQIPATKPLPARSTYATRASVLKPKVEEGMVKAAHMVGTSYRLAPAQKEKLNQKVNPQETTKKEPVKIIIDDSEHGTRMGSSEPELQGGTGGEEVKQRTQQINKGEQRGKTHPDTTQSTPSEIERHWPAENKPWHCTIDAIGGITQPRLHNATTPLRRGCIQTVTRGPDDATAPVYRRQSRRRQADKPMTLYHRRNRRRARRSDAPPPPHEPPARRPAASARQSPAAAGSARGFARRRLLGGGEGEGSRWWGGAAMTRCAAARVALGRTTRGPFFFSLPTTSTSFGTLPKWYILYCSKTKMLLATT